jgi:hypothetical protein
VLIVQIVIGIDQMTYQNSIIGNQLANILDEAAL